MKRDSRGRFLKKSGSRSRARKAHAPRHRVHGYTQRRAGKTVRVRRHMSHEPPRATRRRRRRRSSSAHAPRRRARRSRGGARPVIVVANAPRRRGRRTRRAHEAPMMTFGGMAAFGIGGLAGYIAADLVGRYVEGLDPSQYGTAQGGTATTTPNPAPPALPSGITSVSQYNDLVQAVPPTLKRTLWELGVAALGFAGGGIAAHFGHGVLSLLGYGFGFGAAFHIGGDLVVGYVIRPMFVTGTGSSATLSAKGAMMFQHEQNAANAQSTAAAATGGTPLGNPPQVNRGGVTKQLPQGQHQNRVPVMLATRDLGQPTNMTPAPMAPNNPIATPFPTNPQQFGAPNPPTQTTAPNNPTQTTLPNGGGGGGATPPSDGGTPPLNLAPPPSSLSAGPPQCPATMNAAPPCGDVPDVSSRPYVKRVPMRPMQGYPTALRRVA